jgi:hypothetical protein
VRCQDDSEFWDLVLANSNHWWGERFCFNHPVVFSEWTPRVPGLYWRSESGTLRRVAAGDVERQNGRNLTLNPFGKSRVVVGGVGTLRLPPSEQGFRLCSIGTSSNVSAAVPILISPEAWERNVYREGDALLLPPMRWEQMPHEWAGRFPTIAGIPRGVLRIGPDTAVHERLGPAATQIQPFALMEYHEGNSELFAFVFASAVSGRTDCRGSVARFFARYCRDKGRDGRYLTSADVSEPLWDAEYPTPEDLRRSDGTAGSHLRLLERRVREAHLGERTLQALQEALSSLPDDSHLARLSTRIGIPPAHWRSGVTLSAACVRFLDHVPPEKLPELVDALAQDYPTLFRPLPSPS